MILSLPVTLLSEALVVASYARWKEKPLVPLLACSVAANLFTQALLWLALQLFFEQYLRVLFMMEFFIWLIESAILYLYPRNRLGLREAALLSLAMNLTSFTIGWFLPV